MGSSLQALACNTGSSYRPISLDHIGLITRASTHKAEARRFEDRLRAPSHEQANAR